jgi:general secretion pathway protein G
MIQIHKQRSRGFTLIEVLIVVVIMSILAGVVISHYLDSAEDAKKSVLLHNLSQFRLQVELYKIDHQGLPPQLINGSLPQMIATSNSSGVIGPAGDSYPYGPYMLAGLPENPLTAKTTITAVSSFPPTSASGNGGWLYLQSTGQICPDSPGYLTW